MNPKGIELAIEKSEKITYDLDITHPQLIERKRFRTRAPAVLTTLFAVKDLSLACQQGTTLRRERVLHGASDPIQTSETHYGPR